MEVPSVPFSKNGETNQNIKRILTLFSQGHRATQTNVTGAEKKAIIMALQEGKRAVDGYYSSTKNTTRSEGIIAGLKERLSQVEARIAKQQVQTAQMKAAHDSKQSRLDLARANTDKNVHAARSLALQNRQLAVENAKMKKKVTEGKEEWTRLLLNAGKLQGRLTALIEGSLRLQSSHKEKVVIGHLRQQCDDLEEEKAQLESRKESLENETSTANDRDFNKLIKNMAKFILREKLNVEKCLEFEGEMERIRQAYAEKRAKGGQLDPLDASFADFDETIVCGPEENEAPVMERNAKAVRFTGLSQESQPGSQSYLPRQQAEEAEQASQVPMETSSFPTSPTVTSESISPILPTASVATPHIPKEASVASPAIGKSPMGRSPAAVQRTVQTPLPPARPTSPLKTTAPSQSPVKQAANPVISKPYQPEPVIHHEAVEEAEAVMDTSYNNEEPMDTGNNNVGGNTPNSDGANFTFSQFGQSSPVNGGVALFDPSQDVNGGGSAFDTDAVLNLSMNSNGGDFLSMMQGEGGGKAKKPAVSAPAEPNFSFGMFGGDGGSNDGAAENNDFAFDFNGGTSNDAPEASFNFNFGGGDSDPAPSGGGDGGFFFSF